MNLSISGVIQADSDIWDKIWSSCDYSTFFHSRYWAETCYKYSNGTLLPTPLLIRFNDGKCALIPMNYNKILKGTIKKYISTPYGGYGGPISLDELSDFHYQLIFDYIKKKIINFQLRINPFTFQPIKELNLSLNEDFTHYIDLSIGFDNIYHNWSKGNRSAKVQASKISQEIYIAKDIEDWKSYFEVYQDSLRRWGNNATSNYKWQLFQELFNLHSQYVKLWLVKYQNEIISGALTFESKNHVVWWHGATLEAFFKNRPVNLLIYTIIKNYTDKSFKWFDFNPSGGHQGVIDFKESFGTNRARCPVLNHKNSFVKISEILYRFIGK